MTEDLWPDDVDYHTTQKTPVTILKEQGTLLGRRTSNIVVGVVRGVKIENMVQMSKTMSPLSDGKFSYRFYFLAPALGDYLYSLLTIIHDVDFYPLRLDTNADVLEELPVEMKNDTGAEIGGISMCNVPDDKLIATTMEEFTGILKAIFATKKVKRVIEALIAQSGGC